MAKQFSISTVFKTIDKFTAPVNKMMSSVNKMADKTKAASDKTNQALDSTNKSVKKLEGSFRTLNNTNLNKLGVHINSISRKAKDLASALIPSKLTAGIAAVGAAVVGGTIASKISNLELQQVQMQSALESDPAFKGKYSKEQAAVKAKELMTKVQKFGDTQVGTSEDWGNLMAEFLGRGVIVNDKVLRAMGSLAAQHKGGMAGMIETLQSGARGEVSALDQIKNVKAHIENGRVVLTKGKDTYDLGSYSDPKYFERYLKALVDIAEKNFGEYSENIGNTFDSKWSTFTSAITNIFANSVMETKVGDSIKSGLDKLTEIIQGITPSFVNLSQAIWNKTIGPSGVIISIMNKLGISGNSLLTTFTKLIDKVTDFVNSISSQDIENLKTKVSSFISGLSEISKALVSLASFINSITGQITKVKNFDTEVSETYKNYSDKTLPNGQPNPNYKSSPLARLAHTYSDLNNNHSVEASIGQTSPVRVLPNINQIKNQQPVQVTITNNSTAPINSKVEAKNTKIQQTTTNTGRDRRVGS